MIELVEKFGYDVETTTKFISDHNEKLLYYWTTAFETLLLLFAIIAGYFLYKKVIDDYMSFYLSMF